MSAPTALITADDQVQVITFPLDARGLANPEMTRMYFSGKFSEQVAGFDRLVVDMTGVQALDSSALGPLVQKLRDVQKRGGKMALTGLIAPALREIFALTRFDKVFVITPSRAEAIAACR